MKQSMDGKGETNLLNMFISWNKSTNNILWRLLFHIRFIIQLFAPILTNNILNVFSIKILWKEIYCKSKNIKLGWKAYIVLILRLSPPAVFHCI